MYVCMCIYIYIYIVSDFGSSVIPEDYCGISRRAIGEVVEGCIGWLYLYMHMYVCMYVCMNVCMYVCMYACMYVCMYIYIYMYVYIYVYVYNRHLGLINALPYFLFPPNDLFHYWFTIKKARNIHNYGQDFSNHISPLMGGPLCENKIWHFYIINVT